MSTALGRGWLDRLERLGNRLPDPTTLFAIGALGVMGLAELAVQLDWQVTRVSTRAVTERVVDAQGAPLLDATSGAPLERAVLDADGAPLRETVREEVRARSLLSGGGLYWALQHLVENFITFPPLGVVLVGLLGIGVAERSGFIGALLDTGMRAVPPRLLTPAILFAGVMSSMGLDAGYVVLPPVAAALFQAAGRPPLVGLAAVFAGVAAGFSANLLPTSLDPLLGQLSTAAAQLVAPGYAVAATANWWFMIASTGLLTGVGWAVTALWVEPRFAQAGATGHAAPGSAGDAEAPDAARGAGPATGPRERRALRWALVAAAASVGVFALATWIPGAPLAGADGPFPRWVRVIVPLLFLGFFVPGVVYGIAAGSVRSDKDVARMMSETMAAMGSYLVLAFFAGQFIAWFAYTGLGEMLALSGGRLLASADWGPAPLMVGFIGVVALANLLIGSMSAKYAFFAPVFVPMFMQAGVSPELTQAAYRVGDSVTNVITPLNPYVVILLVFMQRHAPQAGLGTLLALMLPYALVFAVVWTLMLAAWVQLGIPLGPAGPLAYTP